MPVELVAGVDLGGTSLLAVVADRSGKIRGEAEADTIRDQGPSKIIEQICVAVTAASQKAGIKPASLRALGIGACGAVEPHTGVVRVAPNLGWKNVPLAAELRKKLGVKTSVENDVHVGLLGEHAYGAAKGARSCAGIWVGTGVGGALILDGELWTGWRGSAGELGHTVLLPDGPICSCKRHGCAEALCSRTAMERDVRAAHKAGRKTHVFKIMKKREKARMTSSVIEKALEKGDKVMDEVFGRAQHYLGLLAGNLLNTLDLEVVVIGGGIAERMGDRFVKPIRTVARVRLLNSHDASKIRIVPSALGCYSGALGACVLAWKAQAAR